MCAPSTSASVIMMILWYLSLSYPRAPRAPADSKLGLEIVIKGPGPLQQAPSHISGGPSWAE